MTVAIPEAAAVAAPSSAAAGAGGARAGGASRSRAVQRRPTSAEMGRAGPRGQEGGGGPRGPQGPSGRAGAAASERPERQRRERPERKERSKHRSEAARRITGASTRSGGQLHNYQAIIAAEFVAAELLVALRPIATQKPEAVQSSTGGKSFSPYYVQDLIKLVAIGLVFLILEGAAAGPRGLARFSAWFGFLILLGVGLSEAANIGAIFQMLAGGGASPVKLTGKQAPAVADFTSVPPLGQPPPGTTGGPSPGIPPHGIL